jgi:ABC-type antimicrobial peptide transport system permease subunit
LARALREAAAATDPDVPLYNLQTLDDIRRGYLEQRRFAMVVVLAFAALTFLLAAAGLYALIAHVVEVQRREVGIRMAVGASPLGIRLNILRGGLIRATWGAVLGIAIAFVGWRLAALQTARLGRISGGDALLVAASLLGVALVATWMPAQRATRVDPATVLRDD